MIIILSAPSGCGKSSIARRLLENDSNLVLSVSATTRAPRPEETDGIDYFFKTKKEFAELELLEHAEIYGNMYGTPKKYVEDKLKEGKDVLFDIDSQGAYQIMDKAPKGKIVSIFILPPNLETLKARIQTRGQDSQSSIETRMKSAAEEIKHAKNYEHKVINDNFDQAVKEIEYIISAERKKILTGSSDDKK